LRQYRRFLCHSSSAAARIGRFRQCFIGDLQQRADLFSGLQRVVGHLAPGAVDCSSTCHSAPAEIDRDGDNTVGHN
jgi:hypothetical protein